MSLPKGYKRLEYIQSSGTQYVNSNFKANQNTRVVIDFEYISGDVVFGAYDTNGANGYGLQAAGGKWYIYYGSKGSAYSSTNVVANTRLVADLNKNVSSLNGNALMTATANTFAGANPLIISGLYNASEPGFLTALKIYSCQIYDNGLLERDFIPCVNASGVAGLWDDVYGVFYGNAGTGEFTAGPVIQAPGKPSGLAHALSVRLVWSAVSGAASYNIYRDGSFVGSSNTPTFVDVSAAENQTYVYGVSAVGQGGEGEPATLTVYTKAGYFEYRPLIESANFQ